MVIEADEPVDNNQSAKQQRLLVEPLYTPKPIAPPFFVGASVELFHAIGQPLLVPAAFLSVGATVPDDWSKKENRSYFFGQFGKAPDVAIEIVSNRRGNGLGSNVQMVKHMESLPGLTNSLRCRSYPSQQFAGLVSLSGLAATKNASSARRI